MIRTKCACSRTRRASRWLTNFYDEALGAVGLKITQFSVLRTIDRMGPVSISALAAEMALDRTTLGRNLGVLERDGLLTLATGEDLRERTVQLTAAAHDVIAQAMPHWEAAQDRVKRLLGERDLETLFHLLSKFEDLT